MSAQHTPVLPAVPGVKSDLINCLVCQKFWHGPVDSDCPHCAAQKPVDLHTALSALPTYRPVRLEFGATMHRDVTPNEAGWIRREDVLAAIAKAAGSAS